MSQRNTAFQPGNAIKFAVLKPAQAVILNQGPLWSGAKTVKITPTAPTPARVELSGVTLGQATDALIQPGPVKRAGGGK